jgi:RNA polymerase sigma factor (sigma-70 family)
MNHAMARARLISDDNRRITAAVAAQGPRLRAFVRRQVADLGDVDDIVQDTFAELVAAFRLLEPIEHVAAWLLRVARNRIIDRYRQRSRITPHAEPASWPDPDSTGEATLIDDDRTAPAADSPEAGYARDVLGTRLMRALDDLPTEQREVFVAHELDGRSFKELAAETGLGVSTLLGRKHAAVRHLRRYLQDIRQEFDE